MFKLKVRWPPVSLWLMIGGIVAWTSRSAASGDTDKVTKSRPESTGRSWMAAKSPATETQVAQADAAVPTTGSSRRNRGQRTNRRQSGCRVDGDPLRGGRRRSCAVGPRPKPMAMASSNSTAGPSSGGSRALPDRQGGTPKAAEAKGPNDAIALMALLGTSVPKTVTVNELTTVASTFTAARFINGEAISGKPLGLRIAAGNAPNLVHPVTGRWGKVLLDPLNSSMTTTIANLDTLGSLITRFATVANDDWRRVSSRPPLRPAE